MNSVQCQEILDLLDSPTAKVEEIIDKDAFQYLFSERNQKVVDYLNGCVEPLTKCALLGTNLRIQQRAMDILESEFLSIREIGLNDGTLQTIFQEILLSNEPDRGAISRVVHLMELCLADFFSSACENFWFITEIVKYFDIPAVVELLVHSITENPESESFISWINDLEFDQRIMDAVENLSSNTNWEYAAGLFEVLDIFVKRVELLGKFISPSRISAIIRPLKTAPMFVIEKHMQVICDMLNDFTAPFIAEDTSIFARILQRETPLIHPDFVLSLKIMTSMVSDYPAHVRGFDKQIIIDAAFRVLSSFQEHSIALREASKALLRLAAFKEHRDDIISRFLLIAEYAFQSNGAKTINAFCYQMMVAFGMKVDWTGFDRTRFDELYEKYVAPLDEMMMREYGR